MTFEGASVFVTGGSRGIGKAIARRFAEHGATRVAIGYLRSDAAAEETAEELRALGAEPVLVRGNVSSKRIQDTVRELGPLDVLVHNAGIAVVKPYDALTVDEWLETLAINVTAPFLLTQQLAPQMPRGSSIVNILSPAAKTGFPGWSSYCMSKFALEGFSQSLREELRSSGVRVINIYPSATDTDIWSGVEGEWPREKMIAAADVAAAVAYARAQPATVVVENVSVASLAGTL